LEISNGPSPLPRSPAGTRAAPGARGARIGRWSAAIGARRTAGGRPFGVPPGGTRARSAGGAPGGSPPAGSRWRFPGGRAGGTPPGGAGRKPGGGTPCGVPPALASRASSAGGRFGGAPGGGPPAIDGDGAPATRSGARAGSPCPRAMTEGRGRGGATGTVPAGFRAWMIPSRNGLLKPPGAVIVGTTGGTMGGPFRVSRSLRDRPSRRSSAARSASHQPKKPGGPARVSEVARRAPSGASASRLQV
jgi:hypothetical protein